MVVSFDSLLSSHAVIKKLKSIEIKQGRPVKTIKFAPRSLDLDLLLHDQSVDIDIDLPRAEILTTAFVLQPLSKLAPELKHPILHETYQALWNKFPKKQQKLWLVDAMLN